MDGQPTTQGTTAPAVWDLGAIYRAIAELLLSPAERDMERVNGDLRRLPDGPVRDCIERFLASSAAFSVEEYTQTLELQPPCPLYLGAYIYEEPTSCRGAGACGRNGYMIELGALYEHFGFALGGGELADFVPAMTEFLAVSLEHPERDGIGLRRRFVEKYVHPGLQPLREKLQKYESVFDLLVEALEMAVNEDLERLADDPVWISPEVKVTIPKPSERMRAHDITMTGMEQK